MSTQVNLCAQSDEPENYREWLLKPLANKQSGDDVDGNELHTGLKKANRSGSFEMLDMERELDVIDDLDELNLPETDVPTTPPTWPDDGVTRIFMEIASKPTEYWLLRPASDQ